MNQIIKLTQRNIRLFLRDRRTVFFSFLSTIILVALYFLFIANIYTQSIAERAVDLVSSDASNFVVYLQMMAGVLILNSLSLSLGAFSTAARDFETSRADSFLLTPITSAKLLMSYLFSGFVISFIGNALTWILSALLIGLLTGYFVSVATILFGMIILLVASFISGCIMLLITAAIKSSTALGVINGVAGTFFGFLCGIYLPYSNMASGTAQVGSFLPYTHLTIWMKQTLLGDAFTQLNIPADMKILMLNDYFSAKNLGLAGADISLPLMLTLCGAFGLFCLIGAVLILRKRMRRA